MGMLRVMVSDNAIGTSILAWFIAQSLKVILTYFEKGEIDKTRFVGSGGMPSSHSAFVTSLATKVGKMDGFNSTTFAIATVIALVIMYDATGVRYEVGKQAKIIKIIANDHENYSHIDFNKLKELVGHKPREVFAGAILGIAAGIIV